ncbi:hypothetical protein FACS189425_04220 [Clostridia bacterium]|nr:hypothetical protein FACS189425_04220 [Clostridia bacterium]
MKKYLLLISVFVCGACTMILELVGTRVLSPFFGTSIYVWASLIGVILGSMSLGYYWGGKIADRNANIKTYALIISVSAILVAIIGFIKNVVLSIVVQMGASNAVGGLLAAILLFAPVSFVLAMVSPYAIKLLSSTMENTGKTAGNISAMSTLGSIVGTFSAGFLLIPLFGNTVIISSVAIILIVMAMLVSAGKKEFKSNINTLILIIVLVCVTKEYSAFSSAIIAEKDTKYSTVWIVDRENIRSMIIGEGAESQKFINPYSTELASEYAQFYDLAFHFNPSAQDTLCIGGAGYSYPQYYLDKYPQKRMDVAEIDEEVTELAREYFDLKDDPRLQIFHEDGRIFLNKNEKKYDAIFGDAFSSIAPPYSLSTVESMQKISDSLTDEGVFVLNIITGIEGTKGKFLSAMMNTIEEVFPQVSAYAVDSTKDKSEKQNVIIVALKTEKEASKISNDARIQNMLNNRVDVKKVSDMILTDEHSPVEFLTGV